MRLLKTTFKILPAVIILASALQFMPLNHAQALSGSDFKPGRIIDDAIFTNKNSMTVAQIQAFLDAKVPVCDTNGTLPYSGTTRAAYAASSLSGNTIPFICIKQYYENPNATYAVTHTYLNTSGVTVNTVYNYHQNNYYQITGFTTNYVNGDPLQGVSSVRPIYQNKNGVIPTGAKSAAQLIWDVSQAYNINPQVIIVLLQKEQGLVTDDWAWAVQYEKATGYMCPDTAPCNASYAGFYNQIDSAAWQFRADMTNIDKLDDWGYYGLGWNNVRYSPNATCGTKSVYIENAATAALYKYTPYTPNDAALANLYSTGDACSAYGNRNFWRYFNDWFGMTNIYTGPRTGMVASLGSGAVASGAYVTSDGIQHVITLKSTGEVYETWWGNGNLATGMVASLGSGAVASGAYVTSDGIQHVITLKSTGEVYETWWGNGNLATGMVASLGSGAVASGAYVTSDGIQHVITLKSTGEVYETWWGNGNLATGMVASLGSGAVASGAYVTSDGIQHVITLKSTGEVYETWWGNGNLATGMVASLGSGAVASGAYVTSDGIQHVITLKSTGEVYETWWGNGNLATGMVASLGSGAVASGAYVTSDGIQHVITLKSTGEVYETWWK